MGKDWTLNWGEEGITMDLPPTTAVPEAVTSHLVWNDDRDRWEILFTFEGCHFPYLPEDAKAKIADVERPAVAVMVKADLIVEVGRGMQRAMEASKRARGQQG